MDAATFDVSFRELVAEPAVAAGFEIWGKGLWLQAEGLQVALLRTETRYDWPFKFTLVARHDCLRDMDGRRPAPRTRNVSEYPVKALPSKAERLLRRYRYEPHNLGRYPQEEMDEGRVRRQLETIGRALVAAAPLLPQRLTEEVVLQQLERRGEGAWVEQRWIEDYRELLAR